MLNYIKNVLVVKENENVFEGLVSLIKHVEKLKERMVGVFNNHCTCLEISLQ